MCFGKTSMAYLQKKSLTEPERRDTKVHLTEKRFICQNLRFLAQKRVVMLQYFEHASTKTLKGAMHGYLLCPTDELDKNSRCGTL